MKKDLEDLKALSKTFVQTLEGCIHDDKDIMHLAVLADIIDKRICHLSQNCPV